MNIKKAETPSEMESVRGLFRKYHDYVASFGVDLSFQGFDAEVDNLPRQYAAPDGALLMGVSDGKAIGCVALRRLNADTCEMCRLFVEEAFRGMGLGRQLVNAVIETARKRGYSLMRLGTLNGFKKAVRLYERVGFRRIESYYGKSLPDAVF